MRPSMQGQLGICNDKSAVLMECEGGNAVDGAIGLLPTDVAPEADKLDCHSATCHSALQHQHPCAAAR